MGGLFIANLKHKTEKARPLAFQAISWNYNKTSKTNRS